MLVIKIECRDMLRCRFGKDGVKWKRLDIKDYVLCNFINIKYLE